MTGWEREENLANQMAIEVSDPRKQPAPSETRLNYYITNPVVILILNDQRITSYFWLWQICCFLTDPYGLPHSASSDNVHMLSNE